LKGTFYLEIISAGKYRIVVEEKVPAEKVLYPYFETEE